LYEFFEVLPVRLDFCVARGRKDGLNQSDDETNLITLCRECHGEFHGVEWSLDHAELVRAGLRSRPRLAPELEARMRAALTSSTLFASARASAGSESFAYACCGDKSSVQVRIRHSKGARS
jgi:hypothetical protein